MPRDLTIYLSLLLASAVVACRSPDAPTVGRPLNEEEIDYQRRLAQLDTGPLDARGRTELLLRLGRTLEHWHEASIPSVKGPAAVLSESFEEILQREAYVHFEDLLAVLREGDAAQRAVAAAAIGFSRLREPDDPEARAAFRARWPPKAPAAVSALVEQLDDPEPFVVQNALLGLWKLADPATPLEPLLERTRDPDAEIRSMAVLALSSIVRPETGEKAVTTILDALYDPDPRVRNHAVDAAISLAHPATAGRLVQLLDDPYPLLQANAARALGALGDPRNIAPLIAKLERLAEGERERRREAPDRGVPLVRRFVLEALERLSGRDLGEDPDAWRKWWRTDGRSWAFGS